MKFLGGIIIFEAFAWILGTFAYHLNIPFIRNPIFQSIPLSGWILISLGLTSFAIIVRWMSSNWKVERRRTPYKSTVNDEARYSTYSSKMK